MLVETKLLTKRYGTLVALDQCSLAVDQGEVFGLLGPNGSGKTTLLRLLMGFLRPSAGTAQIDGLDCFGQSVAVHRRVSYLPGEVRFFNRMRGGEVLRFFSRVRGRGDAARSLRLAERLKLDLSRPVATLSSGMRQKLALAVALAPDVGLLVLDEPTNNLDPNVRSVCIELVQQARQAGRTVIFSSHVLDEVETVCDRVAILLQGKLVHTQVMSLLRRQHRIRGRLTAPLPPVPKTLSGQLAIETNGPELTMMTPGELSPVLGWLATLPLVEVRIEPVGLRAVYDRYHAVQKQ